ncbi:MAG: hypothetical protein WC882_01355 [Candidatus Gracilibacteria bacterium]
MDKVSRRFVLSTEFSVPVRALITGMEGLDAGCNLLLRAHPLE